MTTQSRLKNREKSLKQMAQMLTSGDLLNFEILFKDLFAEDERCNRLPQFYIHWNTFALTYSSLIPNKITQYVEKKYQQKNNATQDNLGSIEEINDYLLNVNGEFFLDVENINFLKSYLSSILERSRKTKTRIPVTQMYQIEIVIYSLLLREELESNTLAEILKWLPESNVLNIKKSLAEYLNIKIQINKEKPLQEKLKVNKEIALNTGFDSPVLDRAIFLEIKKSSDLSVREKIDLLVMSENYEAALKLIEVSCSGKKSDLSFIVYLTECLFLLKRIRAIKKVVSLLPSFLNTKNEKKFYLYLLKKMLIQQKKYSSSRSLGKLIRRI